AFSRPRRRLNGVPCRPCRRCTRSFAGSRWAETPPSCARTWSSSRPAWAATSRAAPTRRSRDACARCSRWSTGAAASANGAPRSTAIAASTTGSTCCARWASSSRCPNAGTRADRSRPDARLNRLLVIAHVLGGMLMVFAATFALPLAWSLAVGDGSHASFLVSGIGCLAAGGLLWVATRRYRRELEPRDGALLVVLGWLLMSLAGALPFILELPELSFTDACFEAIAGLTTTGATVISGIERLPQSVNVWRHALQWYGGMGIIVMAVAILPMLGVGGMQLFKAEMPGPMKERKLTPRITQTAKALWLIYIGLTGACILALHWAGLDWFEAVCHAFSALALGGFSTRDANIQSFQSPAVEAVLSGFMLVAVLNFSTHFLALRERSLRAYLHDIETRSVLGLILASALGIAAYLHMSGQYASIGESLRHAVFNTVSLSTSTGYMSQDYASWPVF